jgi:hypothetical protein
VTAIPPSETAPLAGEVKIPEMEKRAPTTERSPQEHIWSENGWGGLRNKLVAGAVVVIVIAAVGIYLGAMGQRPVETQESQGGGETGGTQLFTPPIYPGASSVGSGTVQGAPSSWDGSAYSAPAIASTVVNWYKNEMPVRGWTKYKEDTTSGSAIGYSYTIYTLTFTKGGTAAVIQVIGDTGLSEERAAIYLVYGPKEELWF